MIDGGRFERIAVFLVVRNTAIQEASVLGEVLRHVDGTLMGCGASPGPTRSNAQLPLAIDDIICHQPVNKCCLWRYPFIVGPGDVADRVGDDSVADSPGSDGLVGPTPGPVGARGDRQALRTQGRTDRLNRVPRGALLVDERDDRPGLSSSESAGIKLLKGENRRLREDNEILKAASVFFAGALATPAIVWGVSRLAYESGLMPLLSESTATCLLTAIQLECEL